MAPILDAPGLLGILTGSLMRLSSFINRYRIGNKSVRWEARQMAKRVIAFKNTLIGRLSISGPAAVAILVTVLQPEKVFALSPHNIVLQHHPILLWTKVLSNAGITLACFVVFIAVRHFIKNRKDSTHPFVFKLLGLLLIAFGVLHIMKIWGLFQPLYWIMGLIEACTAAISLLAAIAFWPLVPKTLKIKGGDEFEKVQNKLFESEKYLHLLISGITDYAIYLLDKNGTVMSWNEGAERITEYKKEEVIGKNYSFFFPAEDIAQGKPALQLQLVREEGRYEQEAIRLRKDGSPFWANIILTALYDQSGQLNGFAKIIRDITERKLAMNLLQEQADLLELSSDAIIVRDFDGTIRYWNHGAETMYGYTKDQALKQKSQELCKTEFLNSLHYIEKDLLINGRWDGELKQCKSNGQQMVVYSRHVVKSDIDGKMSGVLEINTDITKHKDAEQKQLALMTMERTNTELEQFAYVASHDLQEPLRAIKGSLQILEKKYKGKLDSDGEELMGHAVGGAERMRTLIQDLLSLSRVDSDELTFGAVNLSEVLDQVKSDLAASVKESETVISYHDLPVIVANQTLIRQLFQNLIGNAIKFRGDKNPEISVNSEHKNGEWLFSVIDNGIGFEQTHSDLVFKPFQRLHGREKYPGNGIGLPICKRIVERHGGRIWVESQIDKGTTFYFTIADRATKQ